LLIDDFLQLSKLGDLYVRPGAPGAIPSATG